MKKIMFVCTGNVCRSPMAQYYFNQKIAEQNLGDKFIAYSCGINANIKQKATPNAIDAIKSYGVDMSSHQATRLENSNIFECDLIITLTDFHKRLIETTYPKLKEKVYTLKGFVEPNAKYIDIDDPWGLDIDVYKKCAKEITTYVDKLIEKLKKEVI